jgi:hypothetical protein
MGGCHDHGFTFAGTLTDGNGGPVAGAEVRLVDANNNAISVYTGPEGNFHSSTPWVGPAHVGARDATNTELMVTSLQAGSCCGVRAREMHANHAWNCRSPRKRRGSSTSS